MIQPLQDYNMARFRFYNRRMVEFGIRCGLAMNTMEDSLRQELLTVLSEYTRTNTAIANLLSKHEKTVRNLKRRYKEQANTVQKQNRMFLIANLVHERTWSDPERWLSRDRVLDEYLNIEGDDATFDDEVLDDVLGMLVKEGTLVERRLEYSSFYRTSEQSMMRCLAATTAEEALEVIAAIGESFQKAADSVTEHPDSLERNKFREWTVRIVDSGKIPEMNARLRDFMDSLLAEYEAKVEGDTTPESSRLKVITLIGEEN
jgi:hypothetical protein